MNTKAGKRAREEEEGREFSSKFKYHPSEQPSWLDEGTGSI